MRHRHWTGGLLAALMIPLAAAEVWQEAENYEKSNWTTKQAFCRPDGRGASNNVLLKLYSSKAPGTEGYFAEYTVQIPEDGTYEVWAAISTGTAKWASPFVIEFNGRKTLDGSRAKWLSPAFGGPPPNKVLGWVNPGSVELKKGKQKITFRVTEKRPAGNSYISFFDGFYLTTQKGIRPPGHYRISRLQPVWGEQLRKAGNFQNLAFETERTLLLENIDNVAPQEQISDANADMVLKKLMARPLPKARRNSGIHRFGIHGMEKPFVLAGVKEKETERAFELLARAGADTLRTAELCWHRLGKKDPDQFNYREIDYQIRLAEKYGMNFMFTIGYPPGNYNKGGHHLSTFHPKYEAVFRNYLRTILPKYDKYAQYWEYCNEVDAPHVWWRGATPEEYVRDCRILREELNRLGIKTPVMGISATYSRSPMHDHKGEGQAWTRRAVAAGIDRYVDGYTLHYTWSLKQKGFPEFFRGLSPDGASRRLSNSEESAYTHPSDVIKLFARDLYLYGFESVYYYIARDWIEAGNIIYSGLFDIDWRPKLRLLSYAASADTMKNRRLAGMAEPEKNVEAYLLYDPVDPESCAVVLWKNGGQEEHGSRFKKLHVTVPPVNVHFPAGSVVSAIDWKLDTVPFREDAPVFGIGSTPVIIYCRKLPDWKRFTPAEWLKTHNFAGPGNSKANLPGQY